MGADPAAELIAAVIEVALEAADENGGEMEGCAGGEVDEAALVRGEAGVDAEGGGSSVGGTSEGDADVGAGFDAEVIAAMGGGIVDSGEGDRLAWGLGAVCGGVEGGGEAGCDWRAV